MDALVEIGSVRKTHGFKGEIKLIVEEPFEDDIENAEFIFIGKTEDTALPFEIISIRGADWIVDLAGIQSKEEGAALLNQKVFLREEDVTEIEPLPASGEMEDFEYLIGYSIVDKAMGLVGKIVALGDNPMQILATVEGPAKTFLIPLVDNLIEKIDQDNKKLEMDLPEGLLDL